MQDKEFFADEQRVVCEKAVEQNFYYRVTSVE